LNEPVSWFSFPVFLLLRLPPGASALSWKAVLDSFCLVQDEPSLLTDMQERGFLGADAEKIDCKTIGLTYEGNEATLKVEEIHLNTGARTLTFKFDGTTCQQIITVEEPTTCQASSVPFDPTQNPAFIFQQCVDGSGFKDTP